MARGPGTRRKRGMSGLYHEARSLDKPNLPVMTETRIVVVGSSAGGVQATTYLYGKPEKVRY